MFYDGAREHANRTNAARDGRTLKRSDEASPTAYVVAGALVVLAIVGALIGCQVQAERTTPAASYVTGR